MVNLLGKQSKNKKSIELEGGRGVKHLNFHYFPLPAVARKEGKATLEIKFTPYIEYRSLPFKEID